VSRSVIADLENGRRRYVTTAELCALAWALKVPPIQLLYPDLPDGPVEFIPDQEVSSTEAAMWFSGEITLMHKLIAEQDAALVSHAGDEEWLQAAQQAMEAHSGAQLVQLARERFTRESRIDTLSRLITRLKSENPAVAGTLVEEIEGHEKRIEAINTELRQNDGAVVNDGG
jgi:hypothetical protein